MSSETKVDDTGLLENATDRELRQMFEHMQDMARFDRGHGGYTGTIAEAHDLVIRRDLKFASRHEVQEAVSDFAEKWGPAVAVIVDGEFVFAGIYSS